MYDTSRMCHLTLTMTSQLGSWPSLHNYTVLALGHFIYKNRKMSHTAAGKVGGPKEASIKGSSSDLYLQPDLKCQDVEAGLQGSWKEQTGLCKAKID